MRAKAETRGVKAETGAGRWEAGGGRPDEGQGMWVTVVRRLQRTL